MKSLLFGLIACLWLSFGFADTELPLLGENANLNLLKEKELGKGLYEKLKARGYVIDDPLLTRYLSDIGNNLLSGLDVRIRDYKFFLVKDASVNAFAAPGGYIGVHFGLIAMSRTEDELASVLAHEIAHVKLMHSMQMLEKAQEVNMAGMISLLAAILVSGQNADLASALIYSGAAGSGQAMVNFTRANEYEADRVGIELLKQSSYNPSAMADFMQLLQSREQTGALSGIEYIRTHPVNSNRVAELQARVANHKKTYTKHRFDQFKAYLFHMYPNYAHVEQKTDFTQALELSRNGRYEQANEKLQRLVRSDPDSIWFNIAFAENLELTGDHAQALERYNSLLLLYPDDLAILDKLVSLLIKLDQSAQALKVVQQVAVKLHDEPLYHSMLVKIYRANGKTFLSQLAQADFHWFNGNKKHAVYLYNSLLTSQELDNATKEKIKDKINQQKADGLNH